MLIGIGAYITSRATTPQLDTHGVLNANVHRIAALVVFVLALGVGYRQGPSLGGFAVAWTALGVFLLEAFIGLSGSAVLHASVAPVAFASLTAVVVVTSRGWNAAPELVHDDGVPLLRPLAMVTPALVLMQTVLGATYRHKLTGLIPHLGGAMVVSIAALVGSMLILNHYPKHRALRSAAIGLISVVLAQVLLGVTALAMQLLGVQNSMALVISTASHVVVGSLTLAASLVLAMQVQRHVRRAPVAVAAKSG